MAVDVITPAVSGAIQGAVYGLLGLGLVLLYKSNKVFNFAQAEFGTSAAFGVYFGINGTGPLPKMPYIVAVLFGLFIGTALGLITERLVVRPLFSAAKVTIVVATAGVTLLLIASQGMLGGAEAVNVPPLVSGDLIQAGSLRVTNQGALIVVVLGILAAAAAYFFKNTKTGLAIIAVSQEPTATSLVGISVKKVSLLTWGLAGFIGGVAGILLVGNFGFVAPGALTGLALIPALTAAVFGGITSLPGAFVGGVVIGIVEAEAAALIPKDVISGSGTLTLFFVLLIVLLVRPAGLLGKET